MEEVKMKTKQTASDLVKEITPLLPASWYACVGCYISMSTLGMTPEHVSISKKPVKYEKRPEGVDFKTLEAKRKEQTLKERDEIFELLKTKGYSPIREYSGIKLKP